MGGENAENNFHYFEPWTKAFVAEAEKYKYDGYSLDCQISHKAHPSVQSKFREFLTYFADGLHAKNMSLTVTVRYDFPKEYITQSRADAILGYDYSSNPEAIEGYIREIVHKYPTAGVQFEAHSSWGTDGWAQKIFNATAQANCKSLALWSNLEGVSSGWIKPMKTWVEGAKL